MTQHPVYSNIQSPWPSNVLDLGGSEIPSRLEGDVFDLEIFGNIPKQMDGTFYRVMPDPIMPPIYHKGGEMFVPLDGDGIVSAFRFKDGHVDWTQRYVRTERYKAERKARKPLFGVYRNPFTYHPCVRATLESTANTNVLLHANKLLALKENGQAYELDPVTLETKSYNPFDLRSKTFTAHPKVDHKTGHLIGYGYEAKGLATRDVCYFEIDDLGNILYEIFFQMPFTAMMHDCILTENYLVLYNWSFTCDLERMKQGGHHWMYDASCPVVFAVIPRGCQTVEEIRFYKWRAAMPGHTAGGWETDDGKIIFDTTFIEGSGFPFFPKKSDGGLIIEEPVGPPALNHLARWTIDTTAPSGSTVSDPVMILDRVLEFPRIDERTFGAKGRAGAYDRIWFCLYEETESIPGAPPCLNSLAQLDISSRKLTVFHPGKGSYVQEPVFIPRCDSAPEGDGYVMSMVTRQGYPSTELVILDTNDFTNPIAVVRLPVVLKAGIHGNWVDSPRVEEKL